MAKNITLLGASYSDVPAVNLPQTGGGTARFTDTSVTTAVESDVASGKIFIKADGSTAIGTGSGGGGGGCDVTQDENGFIVLPEQGGGGGGGGGITPIYSGTLSVTTSSTSQTTVDTLSVEIPSAALDEIVICVISDQAGPRDGYFYYSVSVAMMGNTILRQWPYFYQSPYESCVTSGSYGVYWGGYTSSSAPSKRILSCTMQARYSSSYSKTIDGTYNVKFYHMSIHDLF